MNGRERVVNAIKCHEVDRVPWVPFVGCHGGFLIGVAADDFLRSAESICAGAAEAVRRYSPDGLPVVFDLQIEAEALGCPLVWAKENPPAVIGHPLENDPQLLESLSIPTQTQGRIPIALEAARKMRAAHPDIALYGLVTGPFTLALHLMGTGIFMKMFDDPEYVNRVIVFCEQVCAAMAGYYTEAGCDVIAVVDPMTSQIGPDHFRQFVSTPVTALFKTIRDRNTLSSFFVCGQARQNIEVMCDCRPDNVSIDENIPLDYVRDVCKPRGISFGGNLQLTVVLLLGNEDDARRNAAECLQTGGETGFILAPGCDLPYATPPANIAAVTAVVCDPYQRDIACTLAARHPAGDILDMSNYGSADKVIVDIITLDSESCAPCQYMVEAVRSVAPQFEGVMQWREHKIKHPRSIVFMNALMVKNIPTICIDGRITFVSRIPPARELAAAIQKRIMEKLRYRIKQKNGAVFILGKNEEECAELKANVMRAVEELGASVPVSVITDKEEIASYGVLRTPAVVVARNTVKSEGRAPVTDVIKEWIKEIA